MIFDEMIVDEVIVDEVIVDEVIGHPNSSDSNAHIICQYFI